VSKSILRSPVSFDDAGKVIETFSRTCPSECRPLWTNLPNRAASFPLYWQSFQHLAYTIFLTSLCEFCTFKNIWINTPNLHFTKLYAVKQFRSWLRYCATSRKVAVSIPDWGLWAFSLTWSFQPHYGPGSDSPFNRDEYQEFSLGGKGGRRVGLTTLALLCASCLKILGA
jgi:hypothetical protein